MTHNISQDAIQVKHQPLTPNRTDIMPLSVIHIPLLLTPNNPWGSGREKDRDIHSYKKLQFRFYFELEFDVWLALYLKIYYKSYIPFVYERNKKYSIFIIDFVITCNFSSVEIYGILCVRSKEISIAKKSHSFASIWSQNSMFGLKYILRYIISDIYHLSVSDLKSF